MADDWVPPEVDVTKSSPARVYDYGLGGSHNFEVDRAVLDKIKEIFPATPQPAMDNRAFLRRAVRFCQERGIRQFLDLGSGVPTVGNVHEIAQQADPEARVVYVDIDPIAVAHAARILASDDRSAVLRADMRHPESVFADPQVERLLDFDEPIAVLMVAMAHYLSDEDDPVRILDSYRAVMRPGSYLVFSHMTDEDYPEDLRRTAEIFNADTTERMILRGRAEIERLLDGFDLVEPGLVYPALWRPDGPLAEEHDPSRAAFFAGVGSPRA
ncbi:S-adenosyl methyltransferase [Saccharopolyspora antimicrobica]|uniref:S-adenosyl methyltransferase n=1 Tax=Saccharopolyspora antimicrobica TaxID=455193 RepID=A0A1I4T6X3_9PSEU|nr:SAM-dependent methyltransferase [Saccharopolyspora antimicrobica]RKT85834.1 S-adenosyl methyltransferase [Saccharopolyspora antimicrobica]SFM72528.1 S-adenosyl methyltransferase [Saccharopolyspora antimicrobica]